MPGDSSVNDLSPSFQIETPMNCTKFRKSMYLREDEFGPGEWREFQHHRTTCPACAATYLEVERTQEVLTRLKNRTPHSTNPVAMADVVIGEIERERSWKTSASVYDVIVLRLGLPGVRFAIVSVLTFVCVSFLVEYTSGYVHIKGLESSMRTYSSSQSGMPVPFLTQTDAAEVVSDLSRFAMGKKSFFEVSGNWVMINKKSIEDFILLYNELQSIAPKLPPEFRAAHPELWKLLTKKKDAKELDAILKERMSLIRELNDLIPQERKIP